MSRPTVIDARRGVSRYAACQFFLDFLESICKQQQGMNAREQIVHGVGFVNERLTHADEMRAQEKAGSLPGRRKGKKYAGPERKR
jgi:hypothetical protein